MAEYTRGWARKNFKMFGDERYLSITVSNIENTRGIDVSGLNKALGQRGAEISDGYGPFKGKCFRIGHMGDHTLEDVKWLIGKIDDILGL